MELLPGHFKSAVCVPFPLLKITFGKPLDVSKMTVEEANELLFNKVKKILIDAGK